MRTLYTLFALISLVLVALVATAAPSAPTLVVDCTVDPLTGVCTASSGVAFHGSGLSTHKAYEVQAALGGILQFTSGVTVNSGGTWSAPGEVFISPGSWTFTLSEVGHNGSLNNLVAGSVLFE